MHKDKAELDRMKREVAKSTVEKGVNECTRLTKIYEKKKAELERQHEQVRQRLEAERAKVRDYYLMFRLLFVQYNDSRCIFLQVKATLMAEYSSRCSKFESGELPLSPSGGTSMPESLSGNMY